MLDAAGELARRAAVRLVRHGVGLLAASVALGLLWQDLARWLAPWVLVASVGTMYLSTLRLDAGRLEGWLRRPGFPLVLIGWLMIALPVIALAVAGTVPLPREVAAALVLIAAASPIISVGGMCLLLGTDAELLTVTVLPATALSIVSLPLFAAAVGIEGLAPLAMIATLVVVVGSALGGVVLTRRFVPLAALERRALPLDALLVVLVAVVGIGVTDGLTEVIVARPWVVIEYFLWAMAINCGMQALTGFVFARREPREAGSAALIGGCRNMAVLLGLTIGKVEPALQMVLVMGQLQLFLLPALMKPVYAFFGVAARDASFTDNRRRT